MKQQLTDVKKKINYKEYSLKEIALFFEKFSQYICKVEIDNKTIHFKIDKYALTHILGLQHAYANRKDSKQYKGLMV